MANKLFPVGGKATVVSATPTLTVAATYVSGDYVGSTSDEIEFTECVLSAGGSGTIVSAILVDYALQSVAAELWLFDTGITAPADSAAWTITDAMSKTCIGVIPFSTYYASALNSVAPVYNIGLAFKCIAGSTSLWGALVTRGAPSYTSGDLTVRLVIWQD